MNLIKRLEIILLVVKESVGINSGFPLSITKIEVKNSKRHGSLKWSKKNWSPTELVANLLDFDRSLKWPKKGWVIGPKAIRVWAKVRARLASHEEHDDWDRQIETLYDAIPCWRQMLRVYFHPQHPQSLYISLEPSRDF